MRPPVISDQDILSVVDLRHLISDMGQAIVSGIRAKAVILQRSSILREAPFGAFGALPAFSEDAGLYTVKAAVFVERGDGQSGSVEAVVSAFSARTGHLLAILEGGSVTRLKCAAVSALVTDWCAVDESSVLGVMGSGVQAAAQVSGVSAVRNLAEVRIFSRNRQHADRFREAASSLVASAAKVTVVGSVEEAIQECDIVSTATTSHLPLAPVFPLANHAHVNCMGSHTVGTREVPSDVLRESTIIVEDRATAVREAGHLHSDAVEVYELFNVPPASLKSRTTVFSSTGHALLDLLTVGHILRALDVNIP